MGEEQRKYPRVPVRVEVAMYDILNHRFAYGTMMDISAGGMRVMTWERFDLHAPLSLDFELAPEFSFSKVPADVMWSFSGEGKYMYGLQFHHLQPDLMPRLQAFVARVQGRLTRSSIKGKI